MRALVALAVPVVFALPALAQSPAFLVKDVNVQPAPAAHSLFGGIHVSGGVALFAAGTPTLGTELWRSDGTEGGTHLVRDLLLGNTGAGGGFRNGFAAGSGTTYFFGADAVHGTELWRTDGTAAGTALVADLVPGRFGSDLTTEGTIGALSAGGFLFAADDGVGGCGVWRTDGTAAGTSLVRAFPRTFGFLPDHFRAIGGVVFFTAGENATGAELWRSDGTPGGTSIVADLAPGAASSSPRELTVIGSELYFSAEPSVGIGRELYKTNGMPGGTVLVKDTTTFPGGGMPTQITLAGGVIYFAARSALGRELWKSNGTAAGTVVVPGFTPGGLGINAEIEALGSAVLFSAAGPELWMTDGTTTQLVRSWAPGSPGATPRNLRTVGSYVYFSDPSGAALWRSDGTAAGTIPLRAFPGGVVPLGTIDGTTVLLQGTTPDLGRELWRSDGTVAGTTLVKNIAVEASNGLPERGNPDRADLDGTLIFDADDGLVGQAVWRSDGTSTGTTLVSDWSDPAADTGFGFPTSYWRAGAQVFFLGSGLSTGQELWRTDGTAVGTGLVADIAPGPPTPEIVAGFDFDGVLLFSAFTSAFGREPWRSDGTPGGTFLVANLNTFSGSSSAPLEFTRVGSSVFFAAVPTNVADRRLWRTDGTAAGTVLIATTGMAEPSSLTAIGGLLYFAARDPLGPAWTIWRSDGAAAGTFALPVPIAAGDTPGPIVGLNGALIYTTQAVSGGGTRIWRTDGTAAGTSLLKDLGPVFGAELRVLGNRVLFAATAPELGERTLFATDGTPAGTGRVRTRGTVPLAPANLTVIGDRLVFTGCDLGAGCEPWVSDGTDGGTRRLADIGPDTDSSNPRRFIRSGDFVYFSAQDVRGRELWAIPLSALALRACEDGWDNDGDGGVDAADPGCPVPQARTESPQCNDGVDNDGDLAVDLADPNCGGQAWLRESPGCGLLGIEGAFFAAAVLARRGVLARRRARAA